MGELPEHVFVTGCPSMDLAAELRGATSLTFDPFERYGGVGRLVDLDEPYLVVLQHPVTTEFRDARAQMVETLEAIDAMGRPALWFWPNVDAGSDGTSKAIRAFREQRPLPKVHFFRNMEPLDFLEVLVGAGCLVGNSSVGIRESSFLGVPVVNIGSRQAGRERGPNVIDVDYDRHQIVDAVERQLAHGHYPGVDLYGAGDAGVRIADLLATAPLAIEKRLAF
jgi:UDP-hydrolysing UDP-N-acetyl-D-glucosamine 2-epimerase